MRLQILSYISVFMVAFDNIVSIISATTTTAVAIYTVSASSLCLEEGITHFIHEKLKLKEKSDAPKLAQLKDCRPGLKSLPAGSSVSTSSVALKRFPGCHLPVGCSSPRCMAF